MYEIVLIANIIWFGLGFHLFALRNSIFAKILVSRDHRQTPVFDILQATGPFLGGFNFAFCCMSILLLIFENACAEPTQRAILLIVIALAHGSQFAANVPIALQNRRGEGVWQVKGLMGFIFVTDFSLMTANALLAAWYFVSTQI